MERKGCWKGKRDLVSSTHVYVFQLERLPLPYSVRSQLQRSAACLRRASALLSCPRPDVQPRTAARRASAALLDSSTLGRAEAPVTSRREMAMSAFEKC
eukprot:6194904-Pleurochrysis_carterae.AAC.4